MSSPTKPLPVTDLLRIARKAARMSQTEVGKELGLSARSVMRWESGESDVPEAKRAALLALYKAAAPEDLQTIAHHLGVMPGALTHHAVDTTPAPAPSRAPEAFDTAVLLAADALDLPASHLRAALAEVLGTAQAHAMTLETVRERLLAAHRRA